MLLVEHKLNFKHDLAELWKERPLNHSSYFQLYWELAVLCLRQANLVKSTSIHLGTQLSCIRPHLKEEKMKKEGMNFNLTKCLKITIKYARTMINAH